MYQAGKRKLLRDIGPRNRKTMQAELRLLFDSKSARQRDELTTRLQGYFWEYYEKHGRRFPWRRKRTSAFHLLVAETLLKQTKANDVVSVWLDLSGKYPTPGRLARAQKATLLRFLKPLGLQRQRCVALTSMAKGIVSEFSGRVPKELDKLLELPYVGLYSACALSCFNYGARVPIVDANILRLLGRLTGDDFGRDLRRNHHVWALAWAILPRERFVAHNYGLLDFSAIVCKARNPECTLCVLRLRCAYRQSRTHEDGLGFSRG